MNEATPQILEKFDADDIFNADETKLFYRATPDGSLTYKYESLSGLEKALDLVTVLCCGNVSGSEKKNLLFLENLRNLVALKESTWDLSNFLLLQYKGGYTFY